MSIILTHQMAEKLKNRDFTVESRDKDAEIDILYNIVGVFHPYRLNIVIKCYDENEDENQNKQQTSEESGFTNLSLKEIIIQNIFQNSSRLITVNNRIETETKDFVFKFDKKLEACYLFIRVNRKTPDGSPVSYDVETDAAFFFDRRSGSNIPFSSWVSGLAVRGNTIFDKLYLDKDSNKWVYPLEKEPVSQKSIAELYSIAKNNIEPSSSSSNTNTPKVEKKHLNDAAQDTHLRRQIQAVKCLDKNHEKYAFREYCSIVYMILNVNDYMECQGTPIDPKNILNEYKHNTSCIVVYDRNKKIVEFQFRSTSSKYNLTKFIKTISLEHSMGMGLHNRIEPQDSRLVYDVPIQESMEVVIKKMLKKFVNYMCKIDGIVEHSEEYITD